MTKSSFLKLSICNRSPSKVETQFWNVANTTNYFVFCNDIHED